MCNIRFLLIGLLLVLFFSSCESRRKIDRSRPDIIILLADDLGYGDLPSYGNPYIKTPHLDELVLKGMKLTRCYSASPVCSPSRAGLITGMIPNRLGIYDWIPEDSPMHISDSMLTIPKILKDRGYETGLFGKWHCNGMFNTPDQPQPDDLGFDFWMATQNNASPSHRNPENFVLNGFQVGKMEGYSSQLVADQVIKWIDSKDKDQPLFAFIPFHEPHEPIASPEDLVEQYGNVSINENQATYYANVTNMDKGIGRILEKLDQQGRLENTLIFFTSDNGPEMLNRYPGTERSYGSPGSLKGMKVQLFEGGVRVPCIIAWDGIITSGQTSSAVAWSLDFLPTIADIVGFQIPKPVRSDGESLLKLFKEGTFKRSNPLFWFYPTAVKGPNVAMIDDRYKLMVKTRNRYLDKGNLKGILINQMTMESIENDSLSNEKLFYDLSSNSSEERSLAEAPSAKIDSLMFEFANRFQNLLNDSPHVDFEE